MWSGRIGNREDVSEAKGELGDSRMGEKSLADVGELARD